MKRLFRVAGALTWLAAGAAICAVIVSVGTVALADVFGRSLSLVVAGAGTAALTQIIVIGVTAGAASVACTFLSKLLAGQFSERLQRRLRNRAVERISHATAAAMHCEHSGDIQSRLSSDVVLLEQLVKTDVLQFASQGLTAVLAAATCCPGTGSSRSWLSRRHHTPSRGVLSVEALEPLMRPPRRLLDRRRRYSGSSIGRRGHPGHERR